jgi:hypothetical protein
MIEFTSEGKIRCFGWLPVINRHAIIDCVYDTESIAEDRGRELAAMVGTPTAPATACYYDQTVGSDVLEQYVDDMPSQWNAVGAVEL